MLVKDVLKVPMVVVLADVLEASKCLLSGENVFGKSCS